MEPGAVNATMRKLVVDRIQPKRQCGSALDVNLRKLRAQASEMIGARPIARDG